MRGGQIHQTERTVGTGVSRATPGRSPGAAAASGAGVRPRRTRPSRAAAARITSDLPHFPGGPICEAVDHKGLTSRCAVGALSGSALAGPGLPAGVDNCHNPAKRQQLYRAKGAGIAKGIATRRAETPGQDRPYRRARRWLGIETGTGALRQQGGEGPETQSVVRRRRTKPRARSRARRGICPTRPDRLRDLPPPRLRVAKAG